MCYRKLWGTRNRRALILGWAYYLDAFSNYPLRTWLPSVYRGHDNWYTRGASFPVFSQAPFCLCTRGPISVRPEETFARLRYVLGGLRPIDTVNLRLSLAVGPDTRSPTSLIFRHWAGVSPHSWSYDFAETCVFGKQSPRPGRSSFSWEYGVGYFNAVAPGARTLARGIFSTPSYPEKSWGTLRS
ncbi:hypothetical protein Salat_0606200 [Sesamum alatum]|uniref:Uncharacterized protein n=1 Tax=Sesamum alatum TaxID=300844 RepID=A0AAE2CUB9_9LAMI|nr:hypothetical protein Salat_0606200 [Sesamum alatum]